MGRSRGQARRRRCAHRQRAARRPDISNSRASARRGSTTGRYSCAVVSAKTVDGLTPNECDGQRRTRETVFESQAWNATTKGSEMRLASRRFRRHSHSEINSKRSLKDDRRLEWIMPRRPVPVCQVRFPLCPIGTRIAQLSSTRRLLPQKTRWRADGLPRPLRVSLRVHCLPAAGPGFRKPPGSAGNP